MTAEIWMPWRDGTYEVSDLGNVRRARPGVSTFVGRPVKPVGSATGYYQVHVQSDGIIHRSYVHRLVAEAFIGPCPAGNVVNHRDGCKTNNSLVNLEYVTSKQNSAHALATIGRHRGPRKPKEKPKGKQCGEKHWTHRHPELVCRGERMHAKVSEDDVFAIKYLAQSGARQIALARRFGLSVAQTSRIVRGARWPHVKVTLMPMIIPSWLRSSVRVSP